MITMGDFNGERFDGSLLDTLRQAADMCGNYSLEHYPSTCIPKASTTTHVMKSRLNISRRHTDTVVVVALNDRHVPSITMISLRH